MFVFPPYSLYLRGTAVR